MESTENLLSSRLVSLLKNGHWGLNDVVKLFKALVEQFKGRNEDFHTWMSKLLHQVEIHKIGVLDLTLNDQIVENIETKIDGIAHNAHEKSLDEIVNEISDQADIDPQMMAEVTEIVASVSGCLWASEAPHLQGIKKDLFKLCKAAENRKHKPRVTQMVSWCILALSESSRLVQVLTGEGKSCIVAMFAAYQAMKGKTPDIISSSPVLAQRDAEEWSGFYKELGITVDFNTNKSEDQLKKCYGSQVVYGTTEDFAGDFLRQRFHRRDVRPERRFQCVIVDEVDSLMLDRGLEMVYLSSENPLMESLNGLLAEIWWIVNQVKRYDTGQISGPIQLLSQVLSQITDENKGVDPPSTEQANIEAAKRLDDANVAQTETLLTSFVKNNPEYAFNLYLEGPDDCLSQINEISSTGSKSRRELSVLLLGNGKCRVVHDDEDSLVRLLAKGFKKCFQSELKAEENDSHIPGLQDLITGKVQTWIENAMEATKMTLGHEYILHGDGVAPVDYKSTGVVQNNMRWGEGLQQFLEMKHQTKLSNMSLITNFMSNVGLFKKYTNHIYGITGTLGDQAELDMLKKLYDMKTCKIPSFRRRKLYEQEGLVLPEEDEWIRTVCDVVEHHVTSTVYRGPRAALVICETINRAKGFHRNLANSIPKEKLKLYVNNNMDNSTITDRTVKEGDVIIATNLAGRGTDLKVCESVNKAGGLFVVQTFLPLNVRVEQQAFGRTARQGSPGSAQLIMCTRHFSDSVKLVTELNSSISSLLNRLGCFSVLQSLNECLFEEAVKSFIKSRSSQHHEAMMSSLKSLLSIHSFPSQESSLESVKEARNLIMKIRLSRCLDNEVPKVTKKEELFSQYLDVLDGIYEGDVFSDERDVMVPSLHECWGLWLLMNFSNEKPVEMLKEQLAMDLSRAMQKLLSHQSPSTMIYYYIRSGNDLRDKGRLKESVEMYSRALEDGSGEIIPLYNRALATIKMKANGYVAQALADLEKAEKVIDSYEKYLTRIHVSVTSSSQEQEAGDTLLTTQLILKSMVSELLRRNIQDAVMKLKSAESSGEDVTLTEKLSLFLAEDVLILRPRVLIELLMELMHATSLGFDTIFSLDTIFSFSGFFTKLFKRTSIP